MIEGIFRVIQSEKKTVDLKNTNLEYLSAFWSSGCAAIIEKWVTDDFIQTKDFIIKTIAGLDENMERTVAAQLD